MKIRNQWPQKPPSTKFHLNQVNFYILVGHIGSAILNFEFLSENS